MVKQIKKKTWLEVSGIIAKHKGVSGDILLPRSIPLRYESLILNFF